MPISSKLTIVFSVAIVTRALFGGPIPLDNALGTPRAPNHETVIPRSVIKIVLSGTESSTWERDDMWEDLDTGYRETDDDSVCVLV